MVYPDSCTAIMLLSIDDPRLEMDCPFQVNLREEVDDFLTDKSVLTLVCIGVWGRCSPLLTKTYTVVLFILPSVERYDRSNFSSTNNLMYVHSKCIP